MFLLREESFSFALVRNDPLALAVNIHKLSTALPRGRSGLLRSTVFLAPGLRRRPPQDYDKRRHQEHRDDLRCQDNRLHLFQLQFIHDFSSVVYRRLLIRAICAFIVHCSPANVRTAPAANTSTSFVANEYATSTAPVPPMTPPATSRRFNSNDFKLPPIVLLVAAA